MRKVSITVETSELCGGVLSVQDALQQAIDFFDILTDESEKSIIWNLTLASTNSPLTVEGEPIDRRTLSGAHALVEERVALIERSFERIASGLDFEENFPKDKITLARKFVRRNTNGLGATKLRFSESGRSVAITKEIAEKYFEQIQNPIESLHSYLFATTSRKEYGSVEGRIVEIGTDYDAPAVSLKEHKSGRTLWCRIDRQTIDRMAEDIKAKDAWEHRRVRIRGTLNYDDSGRLIRIIDGRLSFIVENNISSDMIEDKNFTSGYSIPEYIDRLRENEFGQ